jgi:regulator of sigma E protease
MSTILFLLLFNLQKFIHELGHFLLAKRAGIVVEEFGIGYPPGSSELGTYKGTRFTFNYLLFGSFIKMLGEKDATIPDGFASKSKLTRLSVLIVGPILNLMTMGVLLTPAIAFFTLAYMAGATEPVTGINMNGEEASVATTVINTVIPDSPAEKVGLQAGDIIIGADKTQFKHAGDLITYVKQAQGAEIMLHIQRESQRMDVPIVPRVDPLPNQGGLGVGIDYEDIEDKITYYPLGSAFIKGVASTIKYSWRSVYMPIFIFRNIILAEERTGPVNFGVGENSLILPPAKIETTQWFPLFWFLGVLSASIPFLMMLVTVISLLPLPGWDSWRILALIFEK